MEWEWTNELVMEFLDLYEGEPAIWNPQHEHYKDRNLVHDAWTRILADINIECSLKMLKKKKENLMATYRKLSMKVKNSKRTGAGPNELYKPEWFAYDKMNSFLHTVYTPRGSKTTEILDNEDETPSNITDAIETSSMSTASRDEERYVTVATGRAAVGPPLAKRRKVEKAGHVGKSMDEVYRCMKQVSAKLKVVKDESYLFCELLCLKLRALDEETRGIAMHEIDNLLFNIKNLGKQQPNMSIPHYYQSSRYFRSYVQQGHVMNQRSSPTYGSRESSVSYVSPEHIPCTSSTPQYGLIDNKSEVREKVGDPLENFNTD